MDNVVIEMSMSLDGYVATPDNNPEQDWARTGCHSTAGADLPLGKEHEPCH
jgi:hypothetical protein